MATSAIPPQPAPRIQSVDALQGAIMILMAIDHIRDYIARSAMRLLPSDLTHTTAAIFLYSLDHAFLRSDYWSFYDRSCRADLPSHAPSGGPEHCHHSLAQSARLRIGRALRAHGRAVGHPASAKCLRLPGNKLRDGLSRAARDRCHARRLFASARSFRRMPNVGQVF
jgi:hypothetical protein